MQDPRELNTEDLAYQENMNTRQIHGLDKGQKIAVAVLAVFAIFVVSFWVIQTRSSLRDPFDRETGSETSQGCIDGNCDEADMRKKDTDGDGLSDYDELNVYNTSPYLEDSDSDGYSDKQEISTQNDPNCPFGQTCHVEPMIVDDNDLTDGPSDFDLNNTAQLDVLEGMDPAMIRSMLLENGMDPEVLDQFSDEDLMGSFNELVNESQ